jgi:hypothetical protein
MVSSIVLFLLGGAFCYYVVLPQAYGFLIQLGKDFMPVIRIDEYLGDRDRFYVTVYHRIAGPMDWSELPVEISNQLKVSKYPWMDRLNWDHTFTPVLLNHASMTLYFKEGEHWVDEAWVPATEVKVKELEAIGTSLAALIPPVGLLGAAEYYRNGYINVKFALLLAAGLFLGAYFGARIMISLPPAVIRRVYGAFLLAIAARMLLFAK